MADNSTPPCILSENDFKTGVAAWQKQAMQADGQSGLLDAVFSTIPKSGAGSRLLYLSMPADWVRYLISTVGCTVVKARFLINESGQFALCFFATDDQNKRVSAYYLLNTDTTDMGNLMAAMYGKPSSDGAVAAGDGDGAVQIPHGVAGDWVKNWQEASTITYDMFATSYGLLQGYNFQRGDLANNLFNDNPVDYQQLRVDFGLHKYYAHNDEATPNPTYTFGLVLRLVNPDNTTSSEPFYDMSTPCPPVY